MTITSRLDRLTAQLSKKDRPPTFEEFSEIWRTADPLSRSLFELSLSSPELTGRPRHYELIKKYLTELGVKADDPLDLEQVLSELKSDDD